MAVVLNYFLFQVGWLACVLSAARRRAWIGIGVGFLVVGWSALRAAHPGAHLLFLLIVGLLGLGWDSMLVATGLLRYAGTAAEDRLAPAWIFVLWLLFATTLDSSLAWLQPHALVALLLGAVGGPLAFLGAARMGVVELLRPRVAVAALAFGWALLMPALSRFAFHWYQAQHSAFALVHVVTPAQLHAALSALVVMMSLAVLGWLASLYRHDVSIVDVLWPLFFVTGALAYAEQVHLQGPRPYLVLVLLSLWSLRLSGHIAWRNLDQPEDRRYQAIRARNEPHFAYKSLYLVFGLQAALAAVVGLPLAAALQSSTPLHALDGAGVVLWLLGMGFEVVGDAQLQRFRSKPENHSQVLTYGLWRFSRHPNYFGEAVLWWGFFAFALAARAGWSVVSPLLMTYLLLRVTGVVLLEHDLPKRRPEYSAYMARTSAFVPWPPRKGAQRSPALTARTFAAAFAPLLAAAGCRAYAAQPITTVSHVELPRFMGDWYVIASIPTRLERGAHNAVESYELRPDGAIATTFRFRTKSSQAVERRYHPVGFVRDRHSNAIWGMQFVWPFKADYRIVYLSPDYSETIIGREARDYVWIMARSPTVSSADYNRLLAIVAGEGYDISRVQRVPQCWDPESPPVSRPGAAAGAR